MCFACSVWSSFVLAFVLAVDNAQDSPCSLLMRGALLHHMHIGKGAVLGLCAALNASESLSMFGIR
jgi:hypothetical protein